MNSATKKFLPRLWELEDRAVPALVVRIGAADDAAGITAIRDTFRDDLGGGTTAGANGSFGGLRREINWDGVPAAKSAPNNLPADFFNVNSPRGAVFSFPSGSAGTGFQVSGNTADVGAGQPSLEFANLNATYPTLFDAFTPQRLFTSVGDNVFDVTFFVPGTTTRAAVSGFGAVFSDVNLASKSSIQLFDANNNSLALFTAPSNLLPAANGGFSFLGIFDDTKAANIAKVRVTLGNTVAGAAETLVDDVVVLDDFLYGEPAVIVISPNAFALAGNSLIPFDTAKPTLPLAAIPITGLTGGETLVGIDFRPANGVLYGVSDQNRLLTINTSTGAATLVAALAADPTDLTNPFTALSGASFGVDFNPVPDRLRVVSDTNQNLRINPANGLVITDGDLNPGTPDVTAAAYLNSFAGSTATTLYVIDPTTDILSIQNPPNNGTLVTVGAGLGVDLNLATGFDILSTNSPSAANAALALGTAGTLTGLYSINLTTGVATFVNTLGDGATAISGLALAPAAAVNFSVTSSAVDENAGTATITVTRSGNTAGPLTVDYAVTGGTATSGQDFTLAPGTLNFADGETTNTITVTLLNDLVGESSETIRVTLTAVTPANINGTTTLVIRDDESPAAQAYAVTSTNALVQFDPATPGTIVSTTTIGGLAVGELVKGIDFRPLDGTLFGLVVNGTNARLVTVDIASGATTQVGAAFTVAGTDFGFDFDPTLDRIRIVSDADINLSVNPADGVVTTQTDLNPGTPNVVGAAYTNSFKGTGSTTLYGIDSGSDSLVIHSPPASGVLTSVGALGVDASGVAGFDILAFNNQALAALNVGNTSSLYTVNLATGAVELLGGIGSGLVINGLAVRDTAVANTNPTVSDIADKTGAFGKNVGPLAFTIGDTEDAPGNLGVSATSSNTTLFPAGSITFGGSDENRTVLLVPAAGQSGTSTITLTVTDSDGGTAIDTFTVTVNPFGPRIVKDFAVGRDTGGKSTASLYDQDGTVRYSVTPFGDTFTGGVRVVSADFNGDGIGDLAVASGPGRAGQIRVFDGVSQGVMFELTPFGDTFTRGVLVGAGDLNNDGFAELIITAEAGGGARMRIFQSTGATFFQRSDFIALIGSDGVADTGFRGGSRGTVADINGDGIGDLVFAAGNGGGPRIATFNGQMLGLNGGPKLTGDFFALSSALRDGAFVFGGDFNADGFGDLAVGGGSGATPQVVVYSGAALLVGQFTKLADFIYGTNTTTQGVRVAVKDLNNDNRADLVVGSAPTAGSRVTGFSITTLGNPPTELFAFDAFPGFTGGVFVG